MPIYNGTNQIGDIFYGTNKIGEVWYGNNLVYTSNRIIDLGTGKTWDIKTLYPNLYAGLTTANFFFTTASSASALATVNVAYTGDTHYLTLISGINKSYNATTGILTLNMKVNDSTANVHALLVLKPSALVYLGVGTSFNVKNSYPTKYARFTADNFLIKQIQHFNGGGNSGYAYNGSRSTQGQYTANDAFSLTKSYNSSTGVLTIYMRDLGSTSSGESWDKKSKCYVYLDTKV